jgi:CBS domain-containing membrane protein
MNANMSARCCKIYQGNGEHEIHTFPAEATLHVPDLPARAAGQVELREVMCRDLLCARPDLDTETVIALLVRNHVGCVPVVDELRRPIGMITKFDVVEQLDAFLRSAATSTPLPVDLVARTADELMTPVALTLEETSTLAEAASLMTREDMHHVLVVSPAGALAGIVSSKDIVTWLARDAELD